VLGWGGVGLGFVWLVVGEGVVGCLVCRGVFQRLVVGCWLVS